VPATSGSGWAAVSSSENSVPDLANPGIRWLVNGVFGIEILVLPRGLMLKKGIFFSGYPTYFVL
jgi:hypothetical protein